jgi:hypothetical protein
MKLIQSAATDALQNHRSSESTSDALPLLQHLTPPSFHSHANAASSISVDKFYTRLL